MVITGRWFREKKSSSFLPFTGIAEIAINFICTHTHTHTRSRAARDDLKNKNTKTITKFIQRRTVVNENRLKVYYYSVFVHDYHLGRFLEANVWLVDYVSFSQYSLHRKRHQYVRLKSDRRIPLCQRPVFH